MSVEEAPAGYRWEWVAEDDTWKLADLDHTCRMKGCHETAVAALRRRHGKGSRWWYYCAAHLYGREIRVGVVMVQKLVPLEFNIVGVKA